MAIRIESAADLQALLSTMANELVDANVYLKLHQDLGTSAKDHGREFNQARAFWGLTMQANMDAAVFRACKIYDQHRGALGLKSLLETIKANVHVFSEPNFRQRLAGNPFVDSLAAENRVPDRVELDKDIVYVSEGSNPMVRNLVGLRNKLYAHRASREVLNATDLSATYPLTSADVHDLLHCGMEIVNRYSQLFSAQAYSAQMIGHDDYKTVLGALRADLERRDAEIGRQREAYEQAVAGRAGEAGAPNPKDQDQT